MHYFSFLENVFCLSGLAICIVGALYYAHKGRYSVDEPGPIDSRFVD